MGRTAIFDTYLSGAAVSKDLEPLENCRSDLTLSLCELKLRVNVDPLCADALLAPARRTRRKR